MNTILDHQYIKDLLSLGLPPQHYAVAGSGPLFARGWIADPGDIDVVARDAAWEIACQRGIRVPAPYAGVQRVKLFAGHLEILNGWFPQTWPTDCLIDEADIFHGIRFVKLSVVSGTKQLLRRPRDQEHLAIMAAHGCRL